ncbi:hypothetical protein S1OALGB6SA_1875 [Olavius algarvensis spirochete endosymbiont]|uniref:TlpA family protein disulfide reductase n=1 Tax=Olavius algarvensis spirochete endosymbiont TaxID=260710 RepID=UPI00068A5A23|nr:TlpA disulfide reductase family protein [Olavius algarvensis spirochete endosymbiont]VDB00785.1 hypothetical protein S1OALGB6SA_1875 [Olavius algarvensis spirochete endosymbiont]
MRSKSFYLCALFCILGAFAAYANPSTAPDAEVFRSLGFHPIPNGQLFPDIPFLDQDGENLKLSDFNGSVVLLNFWATWCPPCRAEMPSMGKLSKILENKEFAMIPINVQESSEQVEAFLEEFEIDFLVYHDFDGSSANEIGIIGLPTSILIDRDGTALAAVTGAFEWHDDDLVTMMKQWTEKQ